MTRTLSRISKLKTSQGRKSKVIAAGFGLLCQITGYDQLLTGEDN